METIYNLIIGIVALIAFITVYKIIIYFFNIIFSIPYLGTFIFCVFLVMCLIIFLAFLIVFGQYVLEGINNFLN